MKVYAGADPRLPLAELPDYARRVERLGFDGIHLAETVHDSLTCAALVATATERITIRTAVTLAFVRSPTLVAYSAWDLAVVSQGRFELGLGTQIRQHIEGRFAMPWGDPVERMRDYIGALHALFKSFGSGRPLGHDGPYYRLDRLPPYFRPNNAPPVSAPTIWLGGIGSRMCRLAGELADGFITHPTNSSPRYLEAVCLPSLAEGRTANDAALRLVVGGPIATGPDGQALQAEREHQRRLLAFLYSTPAYRPTLDLYGWEDLGPRLQQLIRDDRWERLSDLVTDEVLDTLVPCATYDDLPARLLERYGALATGLLLPVPDDPALDTQLAEVVTALRFS